MPQYDGSVHIDTKLDTKNLTIQMLQVVNQIKKLENQASVLRDRLQELGNEKIPTQEYENLQKELEKANEELSKVMEKQKEWTDLGFPVPDSYVKELDNAGAKVGEIEEKILKLEEAGKAFKIGGNEDEIAKTSEKLQEVENNIEVSKMRLQEMLDKEKPITKEFEKIGNSAKKAFQTIIKHSVSVVKSMLGLFRIQKKTNNGFKTGFMSILRYGIGVRSLFALVNKLRGALKEGLNNFVQYSDSFNESVSALKSSCTQLKNAFAAAFAPIIQMAIPYLQSLINYLIQAANAVSQFVAAVTGKSTWTKAVAVQEDYAKSLNKTAGAAKKAAGALASFDTLEVLNRNDSGGGAGGLSYKDMFEEVPVDDSLIIDPYELGKRLSENLADALERIDWEEIKRRAEELGRNLARFLNGVWENERLVADLGMTVGEALNTAVRFAYGFIDENDWKQMGRFLGVMVQSGLDTFDEEFAGKTAGKLVNGLADAIIGYFETYDTGSLGKEIAGFINAAVEEIDPEDLGTAASLLISGFFAEIGSFFDDANASEIGEKVSQALIRFFLYAGENGRVGQTVGHALASVINAGVDALLGADTSGMAFAFGKFIGDIVVTGISQIDWKNLLMKIILLPLDILVGVTGGVISSLLELLGVSEKAIEKFDEGVSQGTLHFVDEVDKAFNNVSTTMRIYLAEIERGKQYSADYFTELQKMSNLTSEDIDTLIQAMIDMNEEIDLASLGLEGYAGDWQEFSAGTVDLIQGIKDENNSMTESVKEDYANLQKSVKDYTDSVSASSDTVIKKSADVKSLIGQDHVKIEESLDSTGNKYQEYGAKAADALDKASQSADSAGQSISKLNADSAVNFNDMSAKMQEWFSNSIEPYFSKEQWQAFSGNIVDSMEECLDLFTESWNAGLEEWMETNEELYFGYDAWYMQWENMILAYVDAQAEFAEMWQSNTSTWWATMVEPFFTVQKWQEFGQNMKNGIILGFKSIVNEMAGVLNSMITLFNAAFKELEEAMNDLIDDYNKSAKELGTSTLSRVRYNAMPSLKVPALAEGAVIRGGNPFLAVLGDQRAGQTNIEAPASLIEEKVAAGIRNALGSGYSGGDLHIHVDLDGETIASQTLDNFLSEFNRRGFDLSPIGG